MFSKKDKTKCPNCKSGIEKKHSYCPLCGYPQITKREKDRKAYGLLGKSDDFSSEDMEYAPSGFTDKIINSVVSSLVKNISNQFRELQEEIQEDMSSDLNNFNNAEIQNLPNGIRIQLSPKASRKKIDKKGESFLKKNPDQEQVEKLSALPRKSAKTNMKRLNNTVNYELDTPGVESIKDIFIHKLEEGYEVKAIGKKKIYVNSLPVNLPLRKLSLKKNKLLLEFNTEN